MKEFIKRLFSLQWFADAGTSVNATENIVNAYTGDTSARTSANMATSATILKMMERTVI